MECEARAQKMNNFDENSIGIFVCPRGVQSRNHF
jgi:hypothetical protein